MSSDESQDVVECVDAILVFTYGGVYSEWTGLRPRHRPAGSAGRLGRGRLPRAVPRPPRLPDRRVSPDVIVVGAGGGGPVVARELAERGIKVLMLEAGPWLDPDRDYTLLEDDMSALGDGRLRWGPGRPDEAAVGPPPRRRGPDPPARRRRRHHPALQRDLRPALSRGAIDGHWPMSYADLVPYFERVEEFLPVSMVADLATKDALFAAGCEAVGLPKSESKDVNGTGGVASDVERDPAHRQDDARRPADLPRGRRLHDVRPVHRGVPEPGRRAPRAQGQAVHERQLRARRGGHAATARSSPTRSRRPCCSSPAAIGARGSGACGGAPRRPGRRPRPRRGWWCSPAGRSSPRACG